MKTTPVTSSNLAAVGYDASRREMRVVFKSGNVHDHVDVPPEVHSALMAAESHGKHYAKHVRGQYQGRRAGGTPPAPATPVASEPTPAADFDAEVRRFTRGIPPQ